MSGRVNRRNVRTGEQQSACSDKLQPAIRSALSKQKFLGCLFFFFFFFLPNVVTCVRCRDNVNGILTRVRGGLSGVRGPDGGKKFFASPELADRLWSSTSSYSVAPGPFPVEKLSEVSSSSPSVAEDKKRRSCAFTPLMPSWCKQGNFTFVNWLA